MMVLNYLYTSIIYPAVLFSTQSPSLAFSPLAGSSDSAVDRSHSGQQPDAGAAKAEDGAIR